MKDVLSEESKSRTLLSLRLPALPPKAFCATSYYLHSYPNCSVPMKPTKSKKYTLALIVITRWVNAARCYPVHRGRLLQSTRVPVGQGRRRTIARFISSAVLGMLGATFLAEPHR